ncbi:MAG: amidohydrolase family protein [Candidatus Lokiarchaeota archaeon]|nr:amidohydrolase family protein [Candidatus Lokiarchaeota archaeon]
MQIDFHCHIFPGSSSMETLKSQFKNFRGYGFYERIIESVRNTESIETDDIIEKTLFHAKNAGLDKIVLLPLSIRQNDEIKKWYNAAPDKFIPFFNPPEKSTRAERVEELIKTALTSDIYKGLKIMVSFRKKRLNDEIIYPACEVAEKLQVPTLFHTGYPPPGTKKQVLTYSNPLYLEELIASFPKLKLIIAHMGYPFVDIAISLAVQYPNVYLDISNLTYMMPNRLEKFLLRAKEIIGVEKILFGSDAFTPEMLEMTVNNFNTIESLGAKEKDRILGGNARKILSSNLK